MRALIVDDSRAMRTILGRIMGELGFTSSSATDGNDALRVLAQEGPPQVALVDWNMPGMNGIDLVRSVRQNPSYNQVRLVMVTTESELGNVAMALEAGADEYIMKPFTAEMVREKLDLIGVGGR